MTDTETKWSNRVQEWRASGKTPEEFAEGKGFEPSTLRFWASKLRQGKTSPVTERAPCVRMARATLQALTALVLALLTSAMAPFSFVVVGLPYTSEDERQKENPSRHSESHDLHAQGSPRR